MVPTAFDGENLVLDKPKEMSHDECESLCVMKSQTSDGQPVIVSCWKPSRCELELIQKTGRVWVIMYGTTMQPIAVQAERPFEIHD